MEAYRKSLDEFCGLLNQCDVQYLVIGAVAVNYHGFQRATGDIDIWYNPTNENYKKLLKAIRHFGFETAEIESEAYKDLRGVIRLPVPKYTIELISMIDGKFTFSDAFGRADSIRIIEQTAKVISYDDLIANKAQSHRPKDLEDIKQLEIRREEAKRKSKD